MAVWQRERGRVLHGEFDARLDSFGIRFVVLYVFLERAQQFDIRSNLNTRQHRTVGLLSPPHIHFRQRHRLRRRARFHAAPEGAFAFRQQLDQLGIARQLIDAKLPAGDQHRDKGELEAGHRERMLHLEGVLHGHLVDVLPPAERAAGRLGFHQRAAGGDRVHRRPPPGQHRILKTPLLVAELDGAFVAEGAQDRHGNPITSDYVRKILQEKLGEEVRITVLGHVQRGGAPSAFDRNLGTLLGHAAVEQVISAEAAKEPRLIGLRGNRITDTPLVECLEKNRAISDAVTAQDFNQVIALRGIHFQEAFRTFRTLLRALPHPPEPGQKRFRLAVMHAGALSPGMNTAVRVAVRYGLDLGHILLGVRNGFLGFAMGEIEEMNWMSVNGWAPRGGAELGTNRTIPGDSDYYTIARKIEEYKIDGLLIIGGWNAYYSAYRLLTERPHFPAFNIPIVCLPASIDNNLSGTELSVGADTALNNIVSAVDKIKQSAVAQERCFIVEVMGRYCGYLALMSGLATGAERVYMHEEGISLSDLQVDLENLITGFQHGKRLGL